MSQVELQHHHQQQFDLPTLNDILDFMTHDAQPVLDSEPALIFDQHVGQPVHHYHDQSPGSPPSSPEAQHLSTAIGKAPGRKRTQTAASAIGQTRPKRKYVRRAPSAKDLEAQARVIQKVIADPEGIKDMREYDGEGDPFDVPPKTPAAADAADQLMEDFQEYQQQQPPPAADSVEPIGPLERFTFERDARARAGNIKPYWVPVGDNHARDRTASDAGYSVKQRAFSIAINIDRNGLGAMSSPFAANFFANPYVAEHLVKCWKHFANLPATVDAQEWALKDFAAQGCYDRAAQAINDALVKEGLGELEVLSQLPFPSVAPRQKSDPNKPRKSRNGESVPRKVTHSDLIESAAPLDVRFPIPADSCLYAARKDASEKAYNKAKSALSVGDPRSSVGRERHRPARLPDFPSLVAAGNTIPDVPPPDAELFGVLNQGKEQQQKNEAEELRGDDGGYSEEVMVESGNGLVPHFAAPVPVAIADELPSSPVVEVAPPAVVARALRAFMCSLRGTTTNVGIVNCSPVTRSVGVELRPVERVALCV